LVAANKRFEHRPRKNVDRYRWYETTSCNFPERRQRKVFLPEGPPTIDGASVGTEEFGEFSDASRRGTLPHGGDQDNDSAEVNSATEKADRRRRHPFATTVAITTEAEPTAVNGRQIIGPTPGFPRVVSPVKPPTAGAGLDASRLGKILIDIGQKYPETSIANQIMVHRKVLRGLWKTNGVHPSKTEIQ
jgi:hypothetical protein